MLNACTTNNRFPEVTGCGHTVLATTVHYSLYILYERCTPEMKAHIYRKGWSSS